MRIKDRLISAVICLVVGAVGVIGVGEAAPQALPALLPLAQLLVSLFLCVIAAAGTLVLFRRPAGILDLSPMALWRWFWRLTPGDLWRGGRASRRVRRSPRR